MRPRVLAYRVHRFLGPIVAILVVVSCLSGLVLNFKNALLSTLLPNSPCATANLDQDLAAIRSRHVGGGLRIELPTPGSCMPYLVRQQRDDKLLPRVAAYAQGTAAELDDFLGIGLIVEAAGLVHVTLLAGSLGEAVVGLLGLSLTFLAITGLMHWWPGLKSLRSSLRLKGATGMRLWAYVHRTCGFSIATFALLTSVTGTMMAFPSVTESAIALFSPIVDRDRSSLQTVDGTFSAAIELAGKELPGSVPQKILLSSDSVAPYRLVLQRPDTLLPASDYLSVQPGVQGVAAIQDSRQDSSGRAANRLVHSVHVGAIWGPLGQFVLAVCALGLMALTVSGSVIWYSRKRMRDQSRARQALKPVERKT